MPRVGDSIQVQFGPDCMRTVIETNAKDYMGRPIMVGPFGGFFVYTNKGVRRHPGKIYKTGKTLKCIQSSQYKQLVANGFKARKVYNVDEVFKACGLHSR